MSEARFSGVRDEFIVLKLLLDHYRNSARVLPPGYRLGPPRLEPAQRRREKELLEANFPSSWEGVFARRTAGWREDTPVYVLKGDELVGGLYLCAEHEFEQGSDWGQMHYFFVADDEKGKGLHSILVAEAVRRGRSWGLQGVYVNTDRHGLPEVYQRWGAELWKIIPKGNGPGRRVAPESWNWLAITIHDRCLWEAIRRYARGELVDIGCGDKPYAGMTRGIVTRHVDIDLGGTFHPHDRTDILATAYATALPDSSVDTVLCTGVLGRLERPADALREIRRILKPGGFAILSAPFIWHLHEEPRDFFRYTEHGLRYLLEDAGLSVVRVQPLSGFVVTFAQELGYKLNEVGSRLPTPIVRGLQHFLRKLAYGVHSRGWDRSMRFAWCYLAVAKKPL